jgi:hypothetical protein
MRGGADGSYKIDNNTVSASVDPFARAKAGIEVIADAAGTQPPGCRDDGSRADCRHGHDRQLHQRLLQHSVNDFSSVANEGRTITVRPSCFPTTFLRFSPCVSA